MRQGAHALPISYNSENKRQVLRRPPAALQLFFKCWHTEDVIYYFILLCKTWASITSPPWTYKLRLVMPAPPRFPDVSSISCVTVITKLISCGVDLGTNRHQRWKCDNAVFGRLYCTSAVTHSDVCKRKGNTCDQSEHLSISRSVLEHLLTDSLLQSIQIRVSMMW